MLQPVLLEPFAQDQLLLEVEGGPLQPLLVPGRKLGQPFRVTAAGQGRYSCKIENGKNESDFN